MLWVPAGFAHGFLVISDTCEFLYKTTDYWAPTHERCIRWNDPTLAIDWPLSGEPVMSMKDMNGMSLKEAEFSMRRILLTGLMVRLAGSCDERWHLMR
jgi:dTDP-4-dehydrorhamnose 3,5-epimerase